MLRYRLRTLLVLLAVLPPLLWLGWGKYEAWKAIDPQTPLVPVGQTVQERYDAWLAEQSAAGRTSLFV